MRDKHGRTAFEVAVFEGGEKAHPIKNYFYGDRLLGAVHESWQPRLLRDAILNSHRYESTDIKRLALNRNSDINHKFADNDGRTVFHTAVLAYAEALRDQQEIRIPFQRLGVQLLLKNLRLDPNAGDSQGLTVLHHLVQTFEPYISRNILALLMNDRRFDVNKRDNQNRTPLLHAASVFENAQNIATISNLLQLGNTQHDAVDLEGRTFMHHVVMRGVPIIDLLDGFPGVLLDTQDMQGAAPIHYAIEGNFDAFVQFALQHPERVNINRPRNDGKTPFHLVVMQNNIALVEELLAMPGVNINSLDNDVMRPLDHALAHR